MRGDPAPHTSKLGPRLTHLQTSARQRTSLSPDTRHQEETPAPGLPATRLRISHAPSEYAPAPGLPGPWSCSRQDPSPSPAQDWRSPGWAPAAPEPSPAHTHTGSLRSGQDRGDGARGQATHQHAHSSQATATEVHAACRGALLQHTALLARGERVLDLRHRPR